MTTPLLRATGRADLLALPSVLLGFTPTRSVVVIGFRHGRVEFCARFDLDLPLDEVEPVIGQVVAAADNSGAEECVVLGYGELLEAEAMVRRTLTCLGDLAPRPALLTDETSTWTLDRDGWLSQFHDPASSLAAEAVYHGVSICGDRAAAVAPVVSRKDVAPEDLGFARARLASLSIDGALDLLGGYVESMSALTDFDALFLALLLEHEECAAAVVARLSLHTAEAMWPNLVAARQVAPPSAEANVLGLLGIASFFSGRGAAHTSCVEQLERMDPDNPVLGLARAMHRAALPPNRWDE